MEHPGAGAPGSRGARRREGARSERSNAEIDAPVFSPRLRAPVSRHVFSPRCPTAPATLIGPEVDRGRVVSPPVVAAAGNDDVLVITRDDRARSLTPTGPSDLGLTTVCHAVAGSDILVAHRRSVAPTDAVAGTFGDAGPRTALGLSDGGRFLSSVAVDGRPPGGSVVPSLAETADLTSRSGARRRSTSAAVGRSPG